MAEASITPKIEKINKKTRRWKKFKNQKYLQIMAIVGVVWMLIFQYIPMAGIIIAFKRYNIASTIFNAQWVGLKYFKQFFVDDQIPLVIKNTLGISFYKLIIGFPLPILFALLLNELKNVKYKKVVQTVTYLPHFLSWVVLGGIMMNWMDMTGLLTKLCVGMHIIPKATNMIGIPSYFWAIVVSSDIWKELGWNAIIYLAAITSIDQEMYEAATIDGAGRFQKMFKITLPCIKPTIAILLILAVSGLLNSNFDQIFVLRNNLNIDASNVLDIYVYKTGIANLQYSYATAVGLLKSVVALILLLSANFVTKKLNDNTSVL
ncbi:ABC transporter permease [Clostridium oryzae]|uniref:Putative multiple-sugar transport system permease YteP n=1 Tax=Clostridium oryzae TaxID=1450648 RepID=A0A1V4IY87_9CLOT|nr:ABC transporter permease subunit [Clostridium oryzae]OPJ65011.1 putative multiple-sugar transport system permease YteP [Clostridium oryzae]